MAPTLSTEFMVVTSGTVRQGADRNQVIRTLAQGFKIEEQKAARYLGGEPAVLYRNLDRPTADHYCQLLQEIGLQCSVQQSPAQPSATVGNAAPVSQTTTSLAQPAQRPADSRPAEPVPVGNDVRNWGNAVAPYQFMVETGTRGLTMNLWPDVRPEHLSGFPPSLRQETALFVLRVEKKKFQSKLLITDKSFFSTGLKGGPVSSRFKEIRNVEVVEPVGVFGALKSPVLKVNGKEVPTAWTNIFQPRSVGLLLGAILDYSSECGALRFTREVGKSWTYRMEIDHGDTSAVTALDAPTLFGRFMLQLPGGRTVAGVMVVPSLLSVQEREEVFADELEFLEPGESPVFAKLGTNKLVITAQHLYLASGGELKVTIALDDIDSVEERALNDVRVNGTKLDAIWHSDAHSRAFAMLLAALVRARRGDGIPRLLLGGFEVALTYADGLLGQQ